MAHKKKLQIFVSSTYTDLHEERQAAVEAILTAGHIPAGMELFAAGDQSQMSVIKRWIDESDVYLLILGGRYGSIEPESGKSYIELEYEYAVAQNKPFFAVVIEAGHLEEKVRNAGSKVIETDNPQKLKDFRAQVLTRMIRPWRDPKDIKLAIMETMSEFSRREDLVGWIPGSEAVNTGAVAEEIARLAKENADLRQQVATMSPDPATFNGLPFDQMYKILAEEKANVLRFPDDDIVLLGGVAGIFGDSEPALIHLFWMMSIVFGGVGIVQIGRDKPQGYGMLRLAEFGLFEKESEGLSGDYFRLTQTGREFLLRLRLERNTKEAEQLLENKHPFSH